MISRRTRSSTSQFVLQFHHYLRKNWVNLLVLGFVLSLSASGSIVVYEFANQSISDVSTKMMQRSLEDIKSRISSYLTATTSIIPTAKAFLSARQIDTGVVANPDLYTASRIWGYFFNTTSSTANSLFYMDGAGNNLGWGLGDTGPAILVQWPSVVPGINVYTPVNGQIGNLSDPSFHEDGFTDLPALHIIMASGQPYFAPAYIVRVSSTQVQAVITYMEPTYFNDNNQFCCIVGSNVYINAFEGVLASYDIAKDSVIFIADSSGTMISDSTGGITQLIAELETNTIATLTLPHATNYTVPIITAASQYLVGKFGSFADIPTTDQTLQFKYHGVSQILLVGQYARDNLFINIVIIVPYSSFFAKIEFSKHITIAFTVIAVVSAVVRYFFAWRLMSVKGSGISPAEMSSSTVTAGYASTISVKCSTSSTSSLYDSPAQSRKDIFGENSPAVVEKDLP